MMQCLVGDIGGTNSRFALVENGKIELLKRNKFPNREHTNLESVIRHYLNLTGAKPDAACIAVACPILGDKVGLTNIDWTFSINAMQQEFGFKHLHVTNDFTALAMAVPSMRESGAIVQIGSGIPQEQKPIGVLGPGTGLGVSGLLWSGTGWVAIQGEGGQVGLKAGNDLEIEILHYAQKVYGFVCAERILSGMGLPFLHNALLEINGKPREENLLAEDITRRALADKCGNCHQTIDVFCGMLGAFAGDHALTLGAFGGIYIGGGVAPQLEHLFTEGPFRMRFEDKGRFTDYVKQIPTYSLRSHSEVALVGAAVIMNQEIGK
jgi:glucokinase